MSTFDNPFDPSTRLEGCACGRHVNQAEHERDVQFQCAPVEGQSDEKHYENVIASAVMRAVFPKDTTRRAFLNSVGASTALAALSQFFPLKAATEAFAQGGPIEKKDLKVGFIPITCATPIIMAKPMGFYEKPEQRVRIQRIRIAAEVPATERTALEVLRTDTATFTALVEARRNRTDAWYKVPAGRIDVCNVPLPVRKKER